MNKNIQISGKINFNIKMSTVRQKFSKKVLKNYKLLKKFQLLNKNLTIE